MVLWRTFLTDTAPAEEVEVADVIKSETPSPEIGPVKTRYLLKLPDLEIYCDQCDGVRNFNSVAREIEVQEKAWRNVFLVYQCRNCSDVQKFFAVRIKPGLYGGASAVKIGEWPPFGPRVPSRTISLIGPDRDLFLKGRRAESLGLGIGAYAYYRQVVENQKDRILDKIAKVAEQTEVPPDIVQKIRDAKQEIQFSKAIEQVKDAIPNTLYVVGQNPLLLLHKALSRGLHAGTDEECLQLATDIRHVLNELAERMYQVLKDQTELRAAVGRLTKIQEVGKN